jgi:hypothetical protein
MRSAGLFFMGLLTAATAALMRHQQPQILIDEFRPMNRRPMARDDRLVPQAQALEFLERPRI